MKNKKLFVNILIITFFILLVFIYYNKNNYIVKINKEKVYLGEYMIYLREQKINFENLSGCKDIWNANIDGISTEELAKKNALNSIVFVKIMKNKAKNLNIKLTKEEKKQILEISDKIYKELTKEEKKQIKQKTIKKVVKESILQKKAKNYIEQKEKDIESFENIYERLLKSVTIKKNIKIWDKIKRM